MPVVFIFHFVNGRIPSAFCPEYTPFGKAVVVVEATTYSRSDRSTKCASVQQVSPTYSVFPIKGNTKLICTVTGPETEMGIFGRN